VVAVLLFRCWFGGWWLYSYVHRSMLEANVVAGGVGVKVCLEGTTTRGRWKENLEVLVHMLVGSVNVDV